MIPLILVLGGLAVGFLGYTKLDNSSTEIEIGNLEIEAKDKESSSIAYVIIGIGVFMVIGGVNQTSRKY